MVIKDNSVQQINVALLSLDEKFNGLAKKSDLDELNNKIKSIVNGQGSAKLQDGATYNINISGTASYAIQTGSVEYATRASTATSAVTATNATNDSAGNNISTTYLKKSELIDLIYPVNSVYISVADVSPQTFLGGTWEKVSSGRVLQGADSSHAGGTTIEAGLPNITGSIWWNNTWKGGGADGAFTQSTTSLGGYSGSGTDEYSKYTLNASNSSSIYGNSTTVQPPAFVVYIWKRTA